MQISRMIFEYTCASKSISTCLEHHFAMYLYLLLYFQCLNLTKEELSQREVDFIDIVNDPIDESKYKEEEVSFSISEIMSVSHHISLYTQFSTLMLISQHSKFCPQHFFLI